MGYAFTFPIFSLLGGSTVAAYVHYPTISNDMLEKVASREASFNNSALISQSPLRSRAKLLYYQFFALLYRIVGWFASLVLVNSSWTKGHIEVLTLLNKLSLSPISPSPSGSLAQQPTDLGFPAGGLLGSPRPSSGREGEDAHPYRAVPP